MRIHFLPTDNCNLACVFCKGRFGSPVPSVENRISRERAMEMVLESAEMGVLLWSLSGGGEPTYTRYTFDLMKEIKQHGMFGEINTNGTLFEECVVSELVDVQWDHLMVSLDGADAATHDQLRGQRGAFDRNVGITTVLTNQNMHQLVQMVRLAHDMGCDTISFNPVKQPPDVPSSVSISRLECKGAHRTILDSLLPEAAEVAESLGILTNLNGLSLQALEHDNDMRAVLTGARDPAHPLLDKPCYEQFYNMVIDFEGRVSQCCESNRSPDANIMTVSLRDAWFQGMKRIRTNLAAGRLQEYCASCGDWQVARTAELRRALRGQLRPPLVL
ncbi:radical SAM protein [Candidatus Woesearchaeota archaeon]|nr:radical SAM protein [Candidatus Woesearchaeota archaeon]